MPDTNGFSVLNEYNNDFACYYRKLFERYKKITDYSSKLYEEKLRQPFYLINEKIQKNEDIKGDLEYLKNIIEKKFGKTSTLQIPKREYNYYDRFKNKRKYDKEPFKYVEKENFECIDKKLSYNFNYDYCLQDACIYYLKTVYDLYGKLQDEIRFYRSFRNRDFGEILSSMTFGFFSSITRSFNTYDSTANAYESFCSIYLLPDYELLFGSNGICTKFNIALEKVKQLQVEYENKNNLIGMNNNKLIFEIDGLEQTLTLGEILLNKYNEFEDAFNKNNFGIKVNYCTKEDIKKYGTPEKSFIFKSEKPFTFKKESTLLTLIGFEAMDVVSWGCDGEQIIYSRRNIKDENELDELRKLQLKDKTNYFKDSIVYISSLFL